MKEKSGSGSSLHHACSLSFFSSFSARIRLSKQRQGCSYKFPHITQKGIYLRLSSAITLKFISQRDLVFVDTNWKWKPQKCFTYLSERHKSDLSFWRKSKEDFALKTNLKVVKGGSFSVNETKTIEEMQVGNIGSQLLS